MNILHNLTLMLATLLICGLASLNTYADQTNQHQANVQAATATSSELSSAEKEQRRALMEKSIREEKLMMRTEPRDRDNQRRAAGEILTIDVFLGTFLTLLWSTISVFFATYFRAEAKPATQQPRDTGLKIFNATAALLPVMLLWVAISSGHASWWLTFAISATLYGLAAALYKRIANLNLARV